MSNDGQHNFNFNDDARRRTSRWTDYLADIKATPVVPPVPPVATDAAADRRIEAYELNRGMTTVDDLHPDVPPAVILPEDPAVLSLRAFVAENIPHLHRG